MLTDPRGALKRCSLAFLLATAPALAQSGLELDFDCLDGKPSDIAVQRDAGLDPANKRAWIAQGRVRKSIRLSDRERMHVEDRTFDSTIQAYPNGVPQLETAEQVIAVEVNEDRVDGKRYLYTLTEATLYREDISNPANPTDLKWLSLANLCLPYGVGCNQANFQDFEEMRDIKIWNHPTIANRGKVVLLTSHRVVIIKDKDWGLVYKSSADELFDEQLASPGTTAVFPDTTSTEFNNAKVYQFWKLRIADDDATGAARAFVLAEMGSRLISKTRGANMILVCDLDTPNLSLNPSFDRNADSDPGTIEVAFWDPFIHAWPVPPTPPVGSTNAWNDLYTVNSLDAIWDAVPGVCRVYAACGIGSQVQRLDATDWFSTGATPAATRLDVDPAATLGFVNLLIDPDVLGRILVLNDRRTSVVREAIGAGTQPGTIVVQRDTVAEPNVKKGSPHDQALVKNLATSGDLTLWTTGDGLVDHLQKVLDVSSGGDFSESSITLVDEYPGVSSSDGGVYLSFAGQGGGGEIYLPTFGGIIRYTPDGAGGWRSVPSSYVPAEKNGPGSGLPMNTEHMDYGQRGGVTSIFTVAGTGEFLDFEVDSMTRDLEDPVEVIPDVLKMPPYDPGGSCGPWAANWDLYPQGAFYSNDLHYLDTPNGEYVLTIMSNYSIVEPDPGSCEAGCGAPSGPAGSQHTQHAVLLFKWDSANTVWQHLTTELSPPAPYPGADICEQQGEPARLAHTIAMAPSTGSGQWTAFVAHHTGFFSVFFDSNNDTLETKTAFELSTKNNRVCRGLAANEDRLFVWVESSPPELRIYEWDPVDGTVFPGDMPSTEPLGENQYPLTAGGGLISGFGGRSFRMRFHRDVGGTNGSGQLLVAGEPILYQFAWPGAGTANENPEDTLTFVDQWVPGDYAGELQDCRVFDMSDVYPGEGLKVLAVKNSEAFSVVDF